MVEQIFRSPQVKGSVIISNKLVSMSCSRVAEERETWNLRESVSIRKISKLHRIID